MWRRNGASSPRGGWAVAVHRAGGGTMRFGERMPRGRYWVVAPAAWAASAARASTALVSRLAPDVVGAVENPPCMTLWVPSKTLLA